MKHLFIINPTSGKGKTNKFIPIIHSIFKDSDDEYFIELTKYVGHATEIVRSYVEKADYRVYSIGGDGTLNEILNGIVNSTSSLAIVPAGSGNDYARTFYGEITYNDEPFLKSLVSGTHLSFDTVRINNKYFINIASTGLDALVVKEALKFKKLPFISGSFAYYLAIFSALYTFKIRPLDVRIDDDELLSISPILIAFGNGKFYGGGKKVLPLADIQDGKLSICIASNLSKLKVLRLFPKLLKGEHHELPQYVMLKKALSIEIKSNYPMVVNFDGELVDSTYISATIVPRSVQIVKPQIL